MTLTAFRKPIYNGRELTQIDCLAYRDSSNSNAEVQAVVIHPDGTLPALTPAAAVSVTEDTVDLNNSSPTLILAASTTRKGGFIYNASDVNVYISTDSGMTAGFEIYPKGVFQLTVNYGGLVVTNAIYGLSVSGSSKTVRYWVA